jgi:hypothetical protein
MTAVRSFRFFLGAFCFLLFAAGASAQIIDRIQSGIEDLARGMDYVGERAGEMIGSGISLSQGTAAPFVVQRVFDEQYSMGPAPMILLSNEFGEIRVNSWNERLVRVNATIITGADSRETAEQISQLIEISATQGMDYLECKTRLPEIKGGSQVSMVVNYQIMVPQDAGLVVDSFFGDVHINGLGGALVANVQYGGLELSQISGTVRARVLGEFQVNASGLKQGGTFNLQNASGEFSEFQGDLYVQHFRGAVTFKRSAPQSSIHLSSDSGKAHFILPPNANPDLNATLSYGKLESELDVVRVLRGQQLLARHPNMEADQSIVINAAFSDIAISVEGKAAEAATPGPDAFKAFTDTLSDHLPLSEDNSMVIHAMPGNIHIEGVDDTEISFSATRIVWTPSAAAGMDALEALNMETTRQDGVITLKTSALQDMATFSSGPYRVDLHIQAPRNLPIVINAAEGVTTVENIGAGVTLEQQKGEVIIDRAAGALNVVNNSGSVTIKQSDGPARVSARYGVVTLEQVRGDMQIQTQEGRTYIDAPGGGVHVRSTRGDVRLLSLEPVNGAYDILVEDGNLNVFIDPSSDAAISVKAAGGRVKSALPLSGTLERDTQAFFGRINQGIFEIRLESSNGDILLN